MPFSAGETLGPYEIVAPIGAGGMGEVWRARDTKLDREVAIKVLPAAVAKDPERLARFEREAKVLASLNHPNIAQIYGLEESATGRALVMELVPGETLKGPLSLETSLTCARQLAEALEAAHEKGITHRDLKPANIMVTPLGVIKVLDFGLAALSRDRDAAIAGDPSNSPTLTIGATEVGTILGTAGYMSPEQAAGKSVDRRADIWSFGVVVYEILTGKPAFPGESVAETLAGVLKLDPDWNLLPNSTPQPIRRLVQRCLTKDRQQRLQAIGEARITIDEVLSGEVLENTRIAARPKLGRASVVAGIFAAAAIVAFWAPWRPPPTEAPPFTFNIDPPDGEVFFGGLSLSPDGRQIAAPVQDSSGQRYIRVFRLDSLASRRLPETEGALIASWSPDSRYLAFKTGTKLKTIDVIGGPAQYLCDVPSNGPPFTAWNREGAILFSRDDGLWRVSASGNTPTQVTVVDASRQEMFHFFPQFVSDERHFLYWISNRDSAHNALFSGSLDGPPAKSGKPVFDGISSSPVYASAHGDYLLFGRRGALMAQQFDSSKFQLTGEAFVVAPQVGTIGGGGVAASVSNNGVLAYSSAGTRAKLAQFAWFDRSGRHVSDVGPPGDYAEFSLSPDEKAVAVFRPGGGIWTLDVGREGLARRFTFDSSRRPIWSPDGGRIIFAKSGSSTLYEKAVRGTGAEQPLPGSAGVPTGWSRDGRYLLSTNNGDLWIIADGKSSPFQRTEFNESEGQFSPDGKWIAYTSDESKQPEVYVQGFPASGGKWLISTSGGSQPRWRPDGKELFYIASDGKMMAASIRAGVSFEYGTATALFQAPIQDFPTTFGYAVASDGQRFLIRSVTKEAKSYPITVMTNWLAIVKK
jgi:Tol biopolymer transport system component